MIKYVHVLNAQASLFPAFFLKINCVESPHDGGGGVAGGMSHVCHVSHSPLPPPPNPHPTPLIVCHWTGGGDLCYNIPVS